MQVTPAPPNWLADYTTSPPTIDPQLLQPPTEKPPTQKIRVRADRGAPVHRGGQSFQLISFDDEERTIINRQWVQRCGYDSYTAWVLC
jgi:hypothetical protein